MSPLIADIENKTRICASCGRILPWDAFKLRHKPSLRGIRLPNSWCRDCETKHAVERYRNNPEYHRWRQRQLSLKLKRTILTHYGGGNCACVECGESRIECLSIDHINGNGNSHRKTINMISGGAFYLWLRRQGYPDGYQTLCMNCQFLKKNESLNHQTFTYISQNGMQVHCSQCTHVWLTRLRKLPKCCPKCYSTKWNKGYV